MNECFVNVQQHKIKTGQLFYLIMWSSSTTTNKKRLGCSRSSTLSISRYRIICQKKV